MDKELWNRQESKVRVRWLDAWHHQRTIHGAEAELRSWQPINHGSDFTPELHGFTRSEFCTHTASRRSDFCARTASCHIRRLSSDHHTSDLCFSDTSFGDTSFGDTSGDISACTDGVTATGLAVVL
jgi:hypothetical protein